MDRHNPTVSVIIPTLNEAGCIGSLLEGLQRQTFQPLEVIVSDGPSDDGTADVVRRFPAVRLVSAPLGVSNGRNSGAAAAGKGSEWFCFLDADVTAHETFLADCLAEIARRRLDTACPHYRPVGSTAFIRLLHAGYNLTFQLFQKVVPSGGGPCIFVRRSVFEAAGGFPEPPFEDMAFLRRTGQLGRFGFIRPSIGISDRRFREDGVVRTALLYALLGPLFALNLYGLARRIPYRFGHHGKDTDSVQ